MLYLMTGCSFVASNTGIKEVDVFDVIDMLANENENSFLLYLETDNCYSCEEYEKVIEELLEDNAFRIYVMKVNIEENDEDVQNAIEELKVTTGPIEELPTTYYFYQGNLLAENIKEGYQEKEDLETWLKNLQIIQ